MKWKLIIVLGSALAIFLSSFIDASALVCTNNFPMTLNGYTSANCIPSAWANALEAKIGVNSSSVTSTIDYLLNHVFTSYQSGIIKATSTQGLLKTASNLSDLNSSGTARTNLGLTDTATTPSSTFMKGANNLSELTNTSTARTKLGLGDSSLLPSSTFMQGANNLGELTSTSTARSKLGFSSSSQITISPTGTLALATTSVSQFANDAGYATSFAGITKLFGTNILVATTSQTNVSSTVSSLTLPVAATNSVYQFQISYTQSGGGAGTTTIVLAGKNVAQCAFAANTTNNFSGLIAMQASTSLENVSINAAYTGAGAALTACNTTGNFTINMATTTTFSYIYRDVNGSLTVTNNNLTVISY